jgi:crossover junction endodeoxyribonuclease RuvC
MGPFSFWYLGDSMLILGIDPGLHVTGYGLIEPTPDGHRFIEAGVIRTGPDADDLPARLRELHVGLTEVLDEFRPGAVAVEQLYAHYEHPRTAILMGHARGVLLLACASHGVPVFDYAATRIKKLVTGSGRAGKEQVQFAVTRELGLASIPEPHDAADALAVALAHAAAGTAVHGTSNARYTGVNRKLLEPE